MLVARMRVCVKRENDNGLSTEVCVCVWERESGKTRERLQSVGQVEEEEESRMKSVLWSRLNRQQRFFVIPTKVSTFIIVVVFTQVPDNLKTIDKFQNFFRA